MNERNISLVTTDDMSLQSRAEQPERPGMETPSVPVQTTDGRLRSSLEVWTADGRLCSAAVLLLAASSLDSFCYSIAVVFLKNKKTKNDFVIMLASFKSIFCGSLTPARL